MLERDTIRIGDLGKVITGSTPPTKKQELYGEEYPFITPTDIGEKQRIVETERFLSEEGRAASKTRMLPKDAVCITCIGATIGKSCMTSEISLTNQQINSIVVDSERHDPRYVYYLLRLEADRFKAYAGGAATPIINKSTFSDIAIEVPPLPVQRRIAGILSAYDDLIENNARRIALLEEMAQAVYREWFVHFRFPGHEDVAMRETDALGLVPEGWEVATLGDLAESPRNRVKPREDVAPDTPYFGLGDLPKESIALSQWGRAEDAGSTKYTLRRGDILFGKIRPYFHKVGPAPVDGICSTDAIVIRPLAPEYFGLVLGCVSSDEFVAYATQTSSGTKMPRAKWKILVDYPVVVPPSGLLQRFNEVMWGFVGQIHTFIHKNTNLRRTRDLLLPRLVSGEIDVVAAEELIETM